MNSNYTNCKMCRYSIYIGENEEKKQQYWECDCCGKTLCEDCVCYSDNIPVCSECYIESLLKEELE